MVGQKIDNLVIVIKHSREAPGFLCAVEEHEIASLLKLGDDLGEHAGRRCIGGGVLFAKL